MKKDKTLLIMAAGMGSRFGGLKQLEPVGPNGEFIIDYSIYDAVRSGFTKVVFIIKEEIYDIFRETIGKRIEAHIKVEYAFQNDDYIPSKFKDIVKKRTKPLGTAYAIYCAKDKINEPFAVINADDYYGKDAFLKANNYLDNIIYNHYGIVGYIVGNTLSPNGAAKRGVMEVSNNKLSKITESSIVRKEDKIIASPLHSSNGKEIDNNTLVCMNLLLFSPDIFDILKDELFLFLSIYKKDIETTILLWYNNYIKTIDVIDTTSTWYGMTYKEDKPLVVNALRDMTDEGLYPQPLWKNI